MIKYIENVFDSAQHHDIEFSGPLTDWIDSLKLADGLSLHIVVNGCFIPEGLYSSTELTHECFCHATLIPEGGDFLRTLLFAVLAVFVPQIGIPGLTGVGLGLVRAAAFILGSLVINALVPVRMPGDSLKESPSYSFDGISNTAQPGAPVAIIYGEHRVGGNVIAVTVEGAGGDQRLHILIALSEGIVDKISDVYIDDQPASQAGTKITETLQTYSAGTGFQSSGLQFAARYGYIDQDNIRTDDEIDFDDVVAQNVFTDGGQPGVEIGAIVGDIKESGDSIAGTVVIDAEQKFVTNGAQVGMPFVMDTSTGGNWTSGNNQPKQFRVLQVISATKIKVLWQNYSGASGLFGTGKIKYFDVSTHQWLEMIFDIVSAESDSINGQTIIDNDGLFVAAHLGGVGYFTPNQTLPTTVTIANVDSETQITLSGSTYNGKKGNYSIAKIVTRQATKLGMDYTKAWVTLMLPRGRGQVSDDGKSKAWTTKIKMEYRPTSGGSWSLLPDQTGEGMTVVKDGIATFVGDDLATWTETFRVHPSGSLLSADQYEFRFTRLSPFPDGLQNQTNTQVRLLYITEAVEDTQAYANTALLAIRAVSSAQLNGRVPEITCLVKGRKVFDPRSDYETGTLSGASGSRITAGPSTDSTLTDNTKNWAALGYGGTADVHYVVIDGVRSEVIARSGNTLRLRGQRAVGLTGAYAVYESVWSDNPALIFRDILLSVIDTETWHDLLQPLSDRIDDVAISDWADFCDEQLADYDNEKRCRCDIVFDQETEVWNALQTVAAIGRANLVQVGTQFSVVIDRVPSLGVTGFYSTGSIKAGSYTVQYLPTDSRAKTVEVTFTNRERNWRKDVFFVPDQETAYLDRPATLDCRGVTRLTQATRQAKMYLLHTQTQKRAISIETAFESLHNIVGDVVEFQFEALLEQTYGGRVVSYSEASGFNLLTINQTINLETNVSWMIALRMPDDTIVESAVLNDLPYEGNELKLADSLDFGGAQVFDAVFAIGPSASKTKTMRIVSVEQTEEGFSKITMVDYDADIYDLIDSVDVDAPGNPAVPTIPLLSQNVQMVAAPEAVWLEVLTQADEDSDQLKFTCYWTWEPPYYGAVVFASINNGPLQSVGRTWAGSLLFTLPMRINDTCMIRVMPVNSRGELLPALGSASYGVTAANPAPGTGGTPGTSSPVPDVENLGEMRSGNYVVLAWDAVSFPTLAGYEIRRGTSWGWADVIGQTTLLSLSILDTAGFTYLIKAFDASGNYSINASAIEALPISGMPFCRVEEHVAAWPGVLTDCSIVDFGGAYRAIQADAERLAGDDPDVPDCVYESLEFHAPGLFTPGIRQVWAIMQLGSNDEHLEGSDWIDLGQFYTLANGYTGLGNCNGIRYRLTIHSSEFDGETPVYGPFSQGQSIDGPYYVLKVELWSEVGHKAVLGELTLVVD